MTENHYISCYEYSIEGITEEELIVVFSNAITQHVTMVIKPINTF